MRPAILFPVMAWTAAGSLASHPSLSRFTARRRASSVMSSRASRRCSSSRIIEGSAAIRDVRPTSSAIKTSTFRAVSSAMALKLSPLTTWISREPCQKARPSPNMRGITPTSNMDRISLAWSPHLVSERDAGCAGFMTAILARPARRWGRSRLRSFPYRSDCRQQSCRAFC